MHTAIEEFTGKQVNAEEIQPLIDNPANALNLQGDARISLDQCLAWGIEAMPVNNEVRFIESGYAVLTLT